MGRRMKEERMKTRGMAEKKSEERKEDRGWKEKGREKRMIYRREGGSKVKEKE